MDRPVSFALLILRLQARDPAAANEVVYRFRARLAALARRRLHSSVRAHLDPEDIVQSAFRSFFRRQSRAPFELDDWRDLWQVLACITARKCARKAKMGRREYPSSGTLEGCIDPRPSPEEAATMKDTIAYLVHDLSNRERALFFLRLDGWSSREISECFGCTERKVQRLMELIRGRLHRLDTVTA
jgi:RNA polymerase sigma-70 factor (ECF subfamily)